MGEMKMFLRSLPKHWVLLSNLIYSKRASPASSQIESDLVSTPERSRRGPLQALCDPTQPYRRAELLLFLEDRLAVLLKPHKLGQ